MPDRRGLYAPNGAAVKSKAGPALRVVAAR